MTAAETTPQESTRSHGRYVFDVASIPGRTERRAHGRSRQRRGALRAAGADLVTKTLVQTPQLSVYHESAKPGEHVKPHRHGTFQVNYVLRGELLFGNQRVTAGMGYFSPDMLYPGAGDEGAEWIEIHSGIGGIFTDRPDWFPPRPEPASPTPVLCPFGDASWKDGWVGEAITLWAGSVVGGETEVDHAGGRGRATRSPPCGDGKSGCPRGRR